MREENIPLVMSYVQLLARQGIKIYPRTLATWGCPLSRSSLQIYMSYLAKQGVLQRVGQRGGYLLAEKTLALAS